MKKTATFVATLLLAAGAQAACYTVMGPKGNIISQTSTPPVDMSYQLHQTVPYRYGQGATMVFGIADANFTSANLSGRPPARAALAARRQLGRHLDALLPGPTGGATKPTTIRSLRTGRVVRGG